MKTFLGSVVFSLVSGAMMKSICALNIRVLHAMPGRMRLQCNAWKSEPVAEGVADSLRRYSFVERVNISPVTGSLLLQFTQKHLSRKQVDKVMDLLAKQTMAGIEKEVSSSTLLMGRIVNHLDSQVKVASNGIFDLLSLFIIALTAQAVRGFSSNRGNSLQQLFWVYRLLRGGRQVI
jgi:hypothetical protein